VDITPDDLPAPTNRPTRGVSRRGFLTGMGATAAALAAGPVLSGSAARAAQLHAAAMADVELALDDIQGNLLAGFNKDHQALVFLEFASADAGRRWLGQVGPHVASAAEVAAFNESFRKTVARTGSERSAPTATWVNVAVSHAGLARIGQPAEELASFPEDFRAGMRARASVIGDTGTSAPSTWIEPFQRDLHAVVIVAADRTADVDAEVARQEALARNAGVEVAFVQRGDVRADEPGHEHFGFRDGVSQPGVRGFTEPRNPDDENQGVPGQDLLWPGEFVLGYPAQPGVGGGEDAGAIARSGPAWTTNGSYLVFRRLRQDVAGFRAFVTATADAQGMTEDLLGAKLVGRYRSGAPLAVTGARDSDPGTTDPDLLADTAINDFEFADDDPDGSVVPLAAHIRKAYPRDEDTPGGGEEDTQTHRLLRRGIPYGASLPRGDESSSAGDEDRGLLFLCYQTSIERQFEFVQARFVNDPDFPEPGAGQDPIITQDPATGSFTLPGGRQEHVALLQRFVTTTGGEYFFQPSRSALAALSAARTAPDAPTRAVPPPPRRPLAPRGSGGGRDEAPPPNHQRPGGRRGR
jgi:Dyp-type peroxidase family